jgi:hypothetical protein
MRTISPDEWAAILARAKEKKGQEGAVDSSAALKARDSNPPKGRRGRGGPLRLILSRRGKLVRNVLPWKRSRVRTRVWRISARPCIVMV